MAEPSKGTAQQYRGDSRDIVKSDSFWFSSDDVPADATEGYVVQIEDVLARRGVKFNKGRSREVEVFLKFAGIEKELRVNITIRRVLDQVFSPDTSTWVGKWVTLFVQQGIKCEGGEVRTGVRVRNQQTRPPEPRRAASAPARVGAPTHLANLKAVQGLLDAGGAAEVKRLADALAFTAAISGKPISAWPEAFVALVVKHAEPLGNEPLPSPFA